MNLFSQRKTNSAAATPLPADTALGDLDAMLCAIKCRLRAFADGVDLPLPLSLADHADAHLRNGVLECVYALDQVRAMLAHEIVHSRRLEQLVIDAKAALARVPPEVVAGFDPTLRMPVPPPERIKARTG